jgi:exopolysaccharide biosynthesis polyprenyl glycosylphosphotransferase
MQFLIPKTRTSNQWALYQLTSLDLLVLLAVCFLPSLVFPTWSLPPLMMPVYAVLVVLFAFTEGLYKNLGTTTGQEFPVLARAAFFAMTLVLVAAWTEMQPLAALTALGTSLAGLLLWRQVRRWGWNEHFRESHNVLIVGAGPAACAIARALREDALHPSTVVGFLDNNLALSSQVLGRIEDLDWLARAQFIDEVILAVPNEPAVVRQSAQVAFRNHLDIRAVPDLPAGLWPDANVERIGGIPVIALHRESLPSATLLFKRLLDVVGALLALTLVSPLMAAVALLVRLDSSGPVFYSAERTGAKGRPFRCFKFRSMSTGADQLKETLRSRNQREGPIFKLADDPRITRLGRFLRRYSLDELPQLWNVLRGEMSLVGPRPHPVDEVNRYELHHYRRLDMKPGITGLWQITARNSPSFDLNMHLDLTYIENWTLALDLRILMSTIRVLFAPEGA